MLSKLGYSLDFNELTVFDVEVFSIIASEFQTLERDELKQKSRKR